MGKIFALEKDLEVVAQTETLQQTLNAVSNTPAEIVLFEAGLSPNPAEAISDVIRRAEPGTKVIIIAHTPVKKKLWTTCAAGCEES